MTATDELRRMMDERGVEWTVPDEVWNQDSITYWQVGSIKLVAFESENGTLWLNCNSVTDLTPEQAIAATLGAGTCHDKCSRFNAWVCSECGATVLLMFDDYDEPSYSVDGVADVPHFCPNCGRRVIE